MMTPQAHPRVAYEAHLDNGFAAELAAMPGGEDLLSCIQCGTCSGVCPLSVHMDHTPRRILAMARAGMRREVLTSRTVWLCASCYACTVQCPRGIHITDLMYALKQLAIREDAHPRRFPVPVLARELFHLVRGRGRVSEFQLLLRLFLKTRAPFLLRRMPLGWRLWQRGRMPLRAEAIRGRDELRKLLDGAGTPAAG